MSMVADSGRFREAAVGFSQQWQIPFISAVVHECTGAFMAEYGRGGFGYIARIRVCLLCQNKFSPWYLVACGYNRREHIQYLRIQQKKQIKRMRVHQKIQLQPHDIYQHLESLCMEGDHSWRVFLSMSGRPLPTCMDRLIVLPFSIWFTNREQVSDVQILT